MFPNTEKLAVQVGLNSMHTAHQVGPYTQATERQDFINTWHEVLDDRDTTKFMISQPNAGSPCTFSARNLLACFVRLGANVFSELSG